MASRLGVYDVKSHHAIFVSLRFQLTITRNRIEPRDRTLPKMPLQKKTSAMELQDLDFDQDRLDRLCNSLQPLLTKHLSDKEFEVLFQETGRVLRRKNWLARWLEKRKKQKSPVPRATEWKKNCPPLSLNT